MNKTILGIAIVGAFIVGILTANPVVEAVGGWQGAIEEITSEQPVYEVSGISTILDGQQQGNEIQLRCLEGDWMNMDPSFDIVTNPSIFGELLALNTPHDFIRAQPVTEFSSNSRFIGADVRVSTNPNEVAPFEFEATITILCLNPQFLNPDLFN